MSFRFHLRAHLMFFLALLKWQVLGLRIARSAVQDPTRVLVRPTQPSTLKRDENEYLQSVEESEIHCLDNCEVRCNVPERRHSGAFLRSSRPGSAWLSIASAGHITDVYIGSPC